MAGRRLGGEVRPSHDLSFSTPKQSRQPSGTSHRRHERIKLFLSNPKPGHPTGEAWCDELGRSGAGRVGAGRGRTEVGLSDASNA